MEPLCPDVYKRQEREREGGEGERKRGREADRQTDHTLGPFIRPTSSEGKEAEDCRIADVNVWQDERSWTFSVDEFPSNPSLGWPSN